MFAEGVEAAVAHLGVDAGFDVFGFLTGERVAVAVGDECECDFVVVGRGIPESTVGF